MSALKVMSKLCAKVLSMLRLRGSKSAEESSQAAIFVNVIRCVLRLVYIG